MSKVVRGLAFGVGEVLRQCDERATYVGVRNGVDPRRSRRIKALHRRIVALAGRLNIKVCAFSRDDVQETFSYLGLVTKQTTAEALAKHIPALERYLPPPRKIWKSEDSRMGLLEAAA